MTNLVLGISGRLEVGETLLARGFGSGTGLQWQAWDGSAWYSVGTPGSVSYTIQPYEVGFSYRLVANTADGLSTSLATGPVTLDAKKDVAPTLAHDGLEILYGPAEHVTYQGLFSRATFSDPDKGGFAGGSLVVLNTNSLEHGGDGQDILSFAYTGTLPGRFSYVEATRDIVYSTTTGSLVVIGRIDAALSGNGTDLMVVFTSKATTPVINALIDIFQMSNDDDSPELARMLTMQVTDPTGRSAQHALTVQVQGLPDAPVFTSAASMTMEENQTTAGTVAAIDPDREPVEAQGITYSLVGGTGGEDNALFQIDAATGALRFEAAVDYETWNHAPQYRVLVRATDGEGSTTDQAVVVNVTDVNEAPVSYDAFGWAYEDAGPISIGLGIWDADADDTHTITYDATGMVGALTLAGKTFTYDPGDHFQYLGAYSTAQESFTFTVTDAGGLSTTRTGTVNVFGTNDAATISGTLTATVTEDANGSPWSHKVSGDVTVVDPDNGESRLFFDWFGGSLNIGNMFVDDFGWEYSVDNSRLQFLGANESIENVFTIRSWDGTASEQVRITLQGVNDAPYILAPGNTAPLVEAGHLDDGSAVPGVPAVSGTLVAKDADANDTLVWSGSAAGVYGQFSIDSVTGAWTYALDNDAAATQALAEGQTANERFVATVTDSQGATAQWTVALTVLGTNDAPIISDSSELQGVVQEPAGSGELVLDLGGASESFEYSVALEADGGFLVLGEALDPMTGAATQIVLEHFNADGTADTAYGDGGRVTIAGTFTPKSVAIDAAGKAVIAGYTWDTYGETQVDWAIERHNADGSLDLSFGGDGRVVIDLGSYDYAEEVLFGAGGDLFVRGSGAVAKLQPDGSLDPAFGNGGIWAFAQDPSAQGLSKVTIDAQGRFLLWSDTSASVARYLQDGSLDTSFGTDGRTSIAMGERGARQVDLKIAPDGSVLLGWAEYTDVLFHNPISVARLTGDGVPDAVFGSGGQTNSPFSAGSLSLAVDAQGRALIAFSAAGFGNGDLHVIRFDSSGALDTSFGTGGTVTADVGDRDVALGIHVTDGGRILVNGIAESGAQDIAFVRFDENGTPDTTFGPEPAGDVIATGALYILNGDPDAGDTLAWSGSATGSYGEFILTSQGSWTYVLDRENPALETLGVGETATERFLATVSDEYGASASREVVITVVGSYDPPASP